VQRLAGIDGAREAHVQSTQPPRIVAAQDFDQRAPDGAVRAEPMQDRALEPRAARNFGIDVQRVVIAGEAIDERLVQRHRQIRLQVGRTIGRHRPRLRRTFALAAEPAVGTQERNVAHGDEQIAARRLVQLARHVHDRALARALVVDLVDLRLADDGAFHRQRLVHLERLLGMQQHAVVDPVHRVGEPHRSGGERHCECRQRNQVLLVDVLELLRIARVQRADSDAERIEHRVPPCVGLPHRLEGRAHQLVVVERHRRG
jgi:hypothetical protein